MRKRHIFLMTITAITLVFTLVLTGCGNKAEDAKVRSGAENSADVSDVADSAKSNDDAEGSDNQAGTYKSISQEEAMRMMNSEKGYLIVDVRTKEEFKSGHIEGAINVPNESIGDNQPQKLEDKEQLIFVYCRSGSRSKAASEKLAEMGYTKIYEIGGINTWSGEIVKD